MNKMKREDFWKKKTKEGISLEKYLIVFIVQFIPGSVFDTYNYLWSVIMKTN